MWANVVRALGDWDPDQYARVMQWPLREACLAFEELLREDAAVKYQAAQLRHVIIAQWSKEARHPAIPNILRGH